jgi:hypothetical protein
MRPLGVTAIAILTWVRGAFYAWAGLAILGIGHLSGRLVAAVASDTSIENLVVRLGKVLGICALLVAVVYVIVGFGLWALKNWARVLTLIFVALWFLVGLIGLLRHPTPWHMVRSVVEVAILVYLMLPNVKRLFAGA